MNARFSQFVFCTLFFLLCGFADARSDVRWHDSFGDALPEDLNKKLIVLVQFDSYLFQPVSQHPGFKYFSQQAISDKATQRWLEKNALLVGYGIADSDALKVASEEYGNAVVFFCDRRRQVVHFLFGFPDHRELLDAAKLALAIIEKGPQNESLSSYVNKSHDALLTEVDKTAFDRRLKSSSVQQKRIRKKLPAGDPTRISKDNVLRSIELFVAAQSFRNKILVSRFGAGLTEDEAARLIQTTKKNPGVESEAVHLVMSRISDIRLSTVEYAIWVAYCDEFVFYNDFDIETFAAQAIRHRLPVVVKVLHPGEIYATPQKERYQWPHKKETKLARITRGCKTAALSLPQARAVAKRMNAVTWISKSGPETGWLVCSSDGRNSEHILKNDDSYLSKAIKRIKDVNP